MRDARSDAETAEAIKASENVIQAVGFINGFSAATGCAAIWRDDPELWRPARGNCIECRQAFLTIR
jgi:hypothetical protein